METSRDTLCLTAQWLLNSVERWAGADYWFGRESGAALTAGGRLDGYLVPTSWNAPVVKKNKGFGIIGVEVKISRSDFLRGLTSSQYERYAEDEGIIGLYVVTPRGLIKTAELPQNVGHLVVNNSRHRSEWSTVCKRHPSYTGKETPSSVLWRVLVNIGYQHRRELHDMRMTHKEKLRRIGDIVGSRVFSAVRRMDREFSNL